MDKAQFLHEALQPPPLDFSPTGITTRCALSGRPITEGYPIHKIVTDATSQPHEIFKFPSEYCSVETARLFKAMRGEVSVLGNLFVGEWTGGSKPMVSRESAEKGNRPCWHDLVMALEPGQWTVAVFTEESKRRFWLDAPLCLAGSKWCPYLHWCNTSRVLTVDLIKLKSLLRLTERIYSAGFSKDALLEGLFDNFQQVQKIGYQETATMDRELAPYRGTDELLLACFIVQKNVLMIAEQPQKAKKEVCKPQEQSTFLKTPSTPEGQLTLW